jgi:hypothetical protein
VDPHPNRFALAAGLEDLLEMSAPADADLHSVQALSGATTNQRCPPLQTHAELFGDVSSTTQRGLPSASGRCSDIRRSPLYQRSAFPWQGGNINAKSVVRAWGAEGWIRAWQSRHTMTPTKRDCDTTDAPQIACNGEQLQQMRSRMGR